jgi:hypothetical protein
MVVLGGLRATRRMSRDWTVGFVLALPLIDNLLECKGTECEEEDDRPNLERGLGRRGLDV